MLKRILCFLLCVGLVIGMALPVFAVEAEDAPVKLHKISSREEFLAFAESCRLDSFSFDLTVSLESDIDLGGVEFGGVPIFCGTFLGNDHTIRGLVLRGEGSYQGLFRYLTKTAKVENLHIEGLLLPMGSSGRTGGLAGSNEGTITNCSFSGTVSGIEEIGGLVGVNHVSGVIEKSKVSGYVSGSHFAGGIAGDNRGVIRSCVNNALVNTTAQQNHVNLTDITLETLANSESVNTVTNIGGIAGNSTGVIRSCVNRGDVGYRHMGYNIGGIAGTQSGYIADCVNYVSVMGRKEVGGIVGQMEPTNLIEYKEDTLQILERQLNSLGSIVNDTAANVQGGAYGMYAQVDALRDSITDAEDAVASLIPQKDERPDEDTIQAAKNTLSNSMANMSDTLRGMTAVTESMVGALTNNLHAIQNQMNAMRSTLGNAEENLGGTVTDVSDKDTDADLNGKTERCTNYGEILADLNAGGIVGAMAVENDLNHEDDVSISGSNSLNFSSELRCVVKNCKNVADVTANKQNVGGIVGWQSLGLVKESHNNGAVKTTGAEYVGGIAGQSEGYLRGNGAKCTISGGDYVGGIAGAATIATDCVSMVRITDGIERVGAVLGARKESYQEEETPIAGNCYLPVDMDLGAIDGISYSTVAEPVALADFLARENLPEMFRAAEICFRYDNGGESRFRVITGEGFPEEKIPVLPEKDGFIARWAGLEEADLEQVLFDLTFEAEYFTVEGVVSSRGEKGKPLMLIQGGFASDAELKMADWMEEVPVEKGQTLLKAKSFGVSHAQYLSKLRFCIYDWEADQQILLIRGKDGSWRQAETELDGSYLVTALQDGDNAVAQIQTAGISWQIPAIAALVLAILLFVFAKKRKR